MAFIQIDIETFLTLSEKLPVFDVRSPGEYLHAHIPGAISLPLFSDEQRKIIGTAYKQESRQAAVNHGLNYFSERMKIIPGEVSTFLNDQQKSKSVSSSPSGGGGVLVHCWRGGMRSEAVAWLLSLYGHKVYVLKGGYKSFRIWALSQFSEKHPLKILGGFTGSGKTVLLNEMKKKGVNVIDLEKLANHKGSAFGKLGEASQPAQEMFENLLAMELWKIKSNTNSDQQTNVKCVWIEDESRNIGGVNIPNSFWQQMRSADLYFLEIPFEERLNFIVSSYGKFNKPDLLDAIMRINKKLGGLETKNAVNFLLEDNLRECFSILLRHYDKLYQKSLYKRENIQQVLNKIPCESVDIVNVTQLTV